MSNLNLYDPVNINIDIVRAALNNSEGLSNIALLTDLDLDSIEGKTVISGLYFSTTASDLPLSYKSTVTPTPLQTEQLNELNYFLVTFFENSALSSITYIIQADTTEETSGISTPLILVKEELDIQGKSFFGVAFANCDRMFKYDTNDADSASFLLLPNLNAIKAALNDGTNAVAVRSLHIALNYLNITRLNEICVSPASGSFSTVLESVQSANFLNGILVSINFISVNQTVSELLSVSGKNLDAAILGVGTTLTVSSVPNFKFSRQTFSGLDLSDVIISPTNTSIPALTPKGLNIATNANYNTYFSSAGVNLYSFAFLALTPSPDLSNVDVSMAYKDFLVISELRRVYLDLINNSVIPSDIVGANRVIAAMTIVLSNFNDIGIIENIFSSTISEDIQYASGQLLINFQFTIATVVRNITVSGQQFIFNG